MRVNLITGDVRVDWVLADLLQHLHANLPEVDFSQTATPEPDADAYHFYRPQAAVGVADLSRAVLTCHGIGKRNKVQPDGSVVPVNMYGPEDMDAFRRAHLTLVLNSICRGKLTQAGVAPSRIVMVPHPVDPEVFTLRPEHDPESKLVIGVVGRPYGPPDDPDTGEEQKGRATLHGVMRELQPECDRIEWLFLGANWEDEVRIAEGLGFDVEFVQRDRVQYPRDFVAAYHRMDVYLCTSRSEGGPASLPEAMACGVWPLTTPVGMCVDLIGVGYRGNLYAINRHDSAAELVRCKLGCRSSLETARKSLRQRAARWTWGQWARAHYEAYQTIAVRKEEAA